MSATAQDIGWIGVLCLILGVIFAALEYHGDIDSHGSMSIKLGDFDGPIWFLLIVLGIFLLIVDAIGNWIVALY